MHTEQTAMQIIENTDAPVAVEEPKAKGKKGSATTKPASASKAKSPKGAKPAVVVPVKQEENIHDEEKEKILNKIKKEYIAALKKEGFLVYSKIIIKFII
jgi:hypothetical protein